MYNGRGSPAVALVMHQKRKVTASWFATSTQAGHASWPASNEYTVGSKNTEIQRLEY
jgi:hypothetical protein